MTAVNIYWMGNEPWGIDVISLIKNQQYSVYLSPMLTTCIVPVTLKKNNACTGKFSVSLIHYKNNYCLFGNLWIPILCNDGITLI